MDNMERAGAGSRWKTFLGLQSMSRTTLVIVLLLLLLAGATRFFDLGMRVMSHDESEHAYFSWLLAQGDGYMHTPITHGPLQFHLVALSYMLFGDNDFTARIPAAVAGVLAIALLLPFRRWLGSKGMLIAMGLMIVSPYMLFYTRYARNEALILPVALLSFLGLFRYMETRKPGWLYLFAAALCAHYLLKETAFIYSLQLAVFLGLWLIVRFLRETWPERRMAALFAAGLASMLIGAGLFMMFFMHARSAGQAIGASAEILLCLLITFAGLLVLLFPLIRTFGSRLRSDFPSLDLLMVCITLTLPQLAALPALLLGWDPLDYQDLQGMLHTAMVLIVLFTLTMLIGMGWNWKLWRVVGLIFLIPYALFYSTFLTNISGFASGIVGSFGYWLVQQDVQRGGQPWFYYLVLQIPLYEYLAAFGSVLAAMLGLKALFNRSSSIIPASVEKTAKTFPASLFLGFWALASLLLFSYAGERMPWLTVHIALPMILLSGWAFDRIFQTPITRSFGKDALRWSFVVILGLGFLLTARTALIAAFQNQNYANEFLVYAHGEQGIADVMQSVEQLSLTSKGDLSLEIGFDTSDGRGDSGVAWPFTWYLRNYPNAFEFGPELHRSLAETPVLIVSNNNYERLDPLLTGSHQRSDHLRMVWPIQDYHDLSWERVLSILDSPAHQKALWQIWLNRDYQPYAQLMGREINLANWAPSDPMRLYVRNDLAAEILGIQVPQTLALPQDPFAGKYQALHADKVIDNVDWLEAPRAVAAASDGSVYVTDTSLNQVLHLSPQGDLLRKWGGSSGNLPADPPSGKFDQPWGLSITSHGEVVVADTWNHRIQVFSAEGTFLRMWGTFGGGDRLTNLYGPRGVAVDSADRIFVADTGNKRIVVYDAQGNPLAEIGAGGILDEPVGLALDPEGHLYVADTWNQRIVVFHERAPLDFQIAETWPLVAWYGQTLNNKPALAFGMGQTLCTSDPDGYRILCFDQHGLPRIAWGGFGTDPSQVNLPTGLAFDDNDALWVADTGNGRLLKFLVP